MGTQGIRGARTATVRHGLGTAALASAIALALFVPVKSGAWSGTTSQSARTSAGAGVITDSVHALFSVLLVRSSWETGCCA